MKAEINQYVGGRIREVRNTALKITQEELAGRVGISRPSVVNIENGNQQLTIPLLLAFAAALGVNPCDLLPGHQTIDSANGGIPELPSDFPLAYREFINESKPG